ncbi:MAG: class I SAM-dependent methyltransferase [Oligoflexales bacterium]|nr:class I SAM-dependent methyltransferase [Oligoflexales bacterium]
MAAKNDKLVPYDKISSWYDEHRSRALFEKPWLDKAIAHLEPKAKILDLGCGMGEPIADYFVQKDFDVTGVDISSSLLELAQKRLAKAKFIKGDMRDLNLHQKFDLLIAWNSFFHLSKNDQRAMFKVFYNHLNSGGILLITTGSEEGEVWNDNGGEYLFHASLSPDEYKMLLKQNDFKLIEYKISDSSCGGSTVWLSIFKNNQTPL